MPIFDITEKRPRINIFKLGGVYYFKYFFYDPELFRELAEDICCLAALQAC